MALGDQQKLVSVIMEEASILPERCVGYLEEMIETLGDIITLEGQTPPKTGAYFKLKITEKCNALGLFLNQTIGMRKVISAAKNTHREPLISSNCSV